VGGEGSADGGGRVTGRPQGGVGGTRKGVRERGEIPTERSLHLIVHGKESIPLSCKSFILGV